MPTAIVTGGAIRIGRAMALHLAGKGYDIALLYHSSGAVSYTHLTLPTKRIV